MTQVIEKRALDILEKHPFPHKPEAHDVSLFIAGHGTGNNVNSRKIIEEQAEIIRRSERFQNVHPVFMEEDPKIEDCYQLADTENIVMVPFFISDGLHSYEDIPMMLGAPEKVVRERYEAGQPTWPNPTEMHGKRVWYTASIGSEPHLPDVIMERIREAAEWLDKG